MNTAETPFRIRNRSYLTRHRQPIRGHPCGVFDGPRELQRPSIFHHTFQTLGSHHFLTEDSPMTSLSGVLVDANRNDLAGAARGARHRDYVSIAALRSDLCRLTSDYWPRSRILRARPRWSVSTFARGREVTAPLGRSAQTLDEFPGRHCTPQSRQLLLSLHFLALRLQLRTKTIFALACGWPGLGTLGDSVNHIGHHTPIPLDGSRAKLLRLIDRERRESMSEDAGAGTAFR